MKTIMRILSLVLALSLMLCLCACTNDPNETTENMNDSTAGTTEPTKATDESTEPEESTDAAGNGNVTYTVTLVDTEGNPFSGAVVQLCLEACMPGVTDANGVATFTLPEADYYATVTVMPDGYTYSTDAEKYYFEDGSYDVTITLKAAE